MFRNGLLESTWSRLEERFTFALRFGWSSLMILLLDVRLLFDDDEGDAGVVGDNKDAVE